MNARNTALHVNGNRLYDQCEIIIIIISIAQQVRNKMILAISQRIEIKNIMHKLKNNSTLPVSAHMPASFTKTIRRSLASQDLYLIHISLAKAKVNFKISAPGNKVSQSLVKAFYLRGWMRSQWEPAAGGSLLLLFH